jgi:hypothetical protein
MNLDATLGVGVCFPLLTQGAMMMKQVQAGYFGAVTGFRAHRRLVLRFVAGCVMFLAVVGDA